jgi:hypothetical protein
MKPNPIYKLRMLHQKKQPFKLHHIEWLCKNNAWTKTPSALHHAQATAQDQSQAHALTQHIAHLHAIAHAETTARLPQESTSNRRRLEQLTAAATQAVQDAPNATYAANTTAARANLHTQIVVENTYNNTESSCNAAAAFITTHQRLPSGTIDSRSRHATRRRQPQRYPNDSTAKPSGMKSHTRQRELPRDQGKDKDHRGRKQGAPNNATNPGHARNSYSQHDQLLHSILALHQRQLATRAKCQFDVTLLKAIEAVQTRVDNNSIHDQVTPRTPPRSGAPDGSRGLTTGLHEMNIKR